MEGLQFVGLRDVQTMFRVRVLTVFVEGMGPSFQGVKQKIVIDQLNQKGFAIGIGQNGKTVRDCDSC